MRFGVCPFRLRVPCTCCTARYRLRRVLLAHLLRSDSADRTALFVPLSSWLKVGIAFLAGLGFAILAIPLNKCVNVHFWRCKRLPVPARCRSATHGQWLKLKFYKQNAHALRSPVNRWVAGKIGKYSDAMMKHKDERIRLMGEVLHGGKSSQASSLCLLSLSSPCLRFLLAAAFCALFLALSAPTSRCPPPPVRVVKAYAWEDKFAAKIKAVRELELQALKGRKYLDAVCVYLWATTPVLM